MTYTNHLGHLGLILVIAWLPAVSQTDLPFEEPAFTQSPLFALASSISVLTDFAAETSNPKSWSHILALVGFGCCAEWLRPCGGLGKNGPHDA